MKKLIPIITFLFLVHFGSFAQKKFTVPEIVKKSCMTKFPEARHITWEQEKGNFEANWGGKSGEDNSAQFKPSGDFVEIVKAIPIAELPPEIPVYVKKKFNGAQIKEAGKVTDANGKQTFEVEIKGKDLIFSLDGKYLGKD